MTKEQALDYIKTECTRAGVPFEICLHNLKTGHHLKRYPEGTKFTDWVRTEVIKLQPYGTKNISEIIGGKAFFCRMGDVIMKTNDNMTVPQVKIITMTEDELTAKMEYFRRQILSDIKSLMAELPQTTPAETPARTGSNWVSAIELSRKYGVTINTIWRWCKSGKIPQPAKLADKRCTRWNLAEVEQALTRCA